MIIKTKILYVLLIPLVFVSMGFLNRVGAQVEPEFMVTWKANNYVPSDYQGRVLSVDKTTIDIGFEIIDGGKIADLSKTEIFWHINNEFQKSGLGIKNSSFVADRSRGNQLIEIIIPNYQPKGKEAVKLEKSLTIPLLKPEVVIDSPYPNNEIESGSNNFRALLFFFNITNPPSDASFSWSANGTKVEGVVENPDLLTLDTTKLPVGSNFNLTLAVSNVFNELEFAKQLINLKIK